MHKFVLPLDRQQESRSVRQLMRFLASLLADLNLLSLPVADEESKLLGIVTVDDALEAALPTRWVNR